MLKKVQSSIKDFLTPILLAVVGFFLVRQLKEIDEKLAIVADLNTRVQIIEYRLSLIYKREDEITLKTAQ